jgi:hypothetical protein
MIFTGNKNSEKFRIITVRGDFASGMSLFSLNDFIRSVQEESIRHNQAIMFNYEMGIVEMDERFSQIIRE